MGRNTILLQLITVHLHLKLPDVEKNKHVFYTVNGGDGMKISIIEDADIQETEVVIRCGKVDREVEQIIATVQAVGGKITGTKDGESYKLDAAEILYIEAVERKTFLYTENEIYESDKRLYMLENELRGLSFFRASKAIIINLRRTRSIRPEIGSRLILTMDNGEKIVVSRQYAGVIKNVLEV